MSDSATSRVAVTGEACVIDFGAKHPVEGQGFLALSAGEGSPNINNRRGAPSAAPPHPQQVFESFADYRNRHNSPTKQDCEASFTVLGSKWKGEVLTPP